MQIDTEGSKNNKQDNLKQQQSCEYFAAIYFKICRFFFSCIIKEGVSNYI